MNARDDKKGGYGSYKEGRSKGVNCMEDKDLDESFSVTYEPIEDT